MQHCFLQKIQRRLHSLHLHGLREKSYHCFSPAKIKLLKCMYGLVEIELNQTTHNRANWASLHCAIIWPVLRWFLTHATILGNGPSFGLIVCHVSCSIHRVTRHENQAGLKSWSPLLSQSGNVGNWKCRQFFKSWLFKHYFHYHFIRSYAWWTMKWKQWNLCASLHLRTLR